jgi:hypothetical protein
LSKETQRIWYLKNRERILEERKKRYKLKKEEVTRCNREWYLNNKEKSQRTRRDWQLRKRSGITLEEYENVLKDQDNKCAICKNDSAGGRGHFHADHDHLSGKFRGLLCQKCNMALGLIKDDIIIAQNIVSYLEC